MVGAVPGKGRSALVSDTSLCNRETMNEETAQLLAVVAGVALIAIYSVLMMATEGTAGWSWIILVAGIGSLIGGGRLLRRSTGV